MAAKPPTGSSQPVARTRSNRGLHSLHGPLERDHFKASDIEIHHSPSYCQSVLNSSRNS